MQLEDHNWEVPPRRKRLVLAHITRSAERLADLFIGKRGRTNKFRRRTIPLLVFGGFILFAGAVFLLTPPFSYPEGELMKVEKGATIDEVASLLAEKKLVHSASLFKAFALLYGGVIAGEYSFTERQNTITIAARISVGDYELTPVRITVWDGATSAEIATLLDKNLPDFDAEAFYQLAVEKEGMLYPDTYFFYPGDEPEVVVEAMVSNFEKQIREITVSLALAQFGKPLKDVLTMASLLEREAPDMQNRRIIAGLLWNRIANDMPLQVDAAFLYINGKNTFQLTKADLASDSPYNTYTNKGLPPGPIGNPSVDAIIAAATPIKTKYVYYLSDRTGILHYSETFDEHVRFKNKYLD